GHVVVSAAVDSLDLLVPASTRGEDENGNEETRLAPPAKERQSVDLRQPEVEHDRVDLLGLDEKVCALAVRCRIDRVAGLSESFRQLPGKLRFVFSNQNAHAPIMQTNLHEG